MKNILKYMSKFIGLERNDAKYCNKKIELLIIWIILFSIITGLFVYAVNSSVPIMILMFLLTVLVSFIFTISAIYYLHSVKHGSVIKFLPRIRYSK